MANNARKWKLQSGWTGTKLKGYPDWFLNILGSRDLKDEKSIRKFLEPKYEDLPDPKTFKNMSAAVDLIAKAKKEDWPVTVYGDYDVDGVTSTAVVYEMLQKIGLQKIECYIPHREEEGYGLHQAALAEIQKSGAKLVISVDCGINSADIIDDPEFKELNFLVIDHHEIVTEKLPKKAAILHPEMVVKGSNPQKLSAAGMAFFLAKALQSEWPNDFSAGQEKWLLDLVALSTIADVMPLSGTNRILTKFGLTVLSKTKRLGLIELAKVSSIDLSEVNAYHVGFLLGPRLNAAGRIEHAQSSLDLLLTRDPKEAVRLAGELNRLNTERQNLCERILAEAIAEIENSDKKDHEIFLLSNKNWPRGVVGIIAGRLAESYARPVIVFENDGEFHHGSARSVGDFDITAALAECEDCLERFGGHAKAAGLSVSAEKFVIFSDKLLAITRDKIKESDLVRELNIDTEIGEADINDASVDLVASLEPFGYGNPTPVLALKSVKITGPKLVGADQNHLKFQLKDSGLSAIMFNVDKIVTKPEGRSPAPIDDSVRWDLAFTLKYNEWNNRRTIDLRVVDLKKTE